MIVSKKLTATLKRTLLAATAVFALVQCSEEEVTVNRPAAEAETPIAAASLEESVSVTVTGVNTVYAKATDCKTCTFVVPAGSSVVDGKELGFEPGNVICLNAAFKYGELELVNIEGTEERPIVITTVSPAAAASRIGVSASGHPY